MSKAFTKKFLESQKEKLLWHKEEIVNKLNSSKEDIKIQPEDTMEDGDLASSYLNQNLSISLNARDIHRLREIDEALHRIESGTYGYCEETDEPIELKRLEKMPWTRLCIEAAEDLERQQANLKVG